MQTLTSVVSAYAVNALWQVPVIVLAAEAATWLLSGLRAKSLHHVWLGCLLLSLTVPGLSLLHQQAHPFLALLPGTQSMPLEAHGLDKIQNRSHEELRPSIVDKSHERVMRWTERPLRILASFSSLICVLYIASVLFALFRLARGLWQTHRLLQTAERAALPPELLESWNSCLAAFGNERIELLSSSRLSSPATVTWLRPVVILPANLRGAQAGEVSAAFCHELAHIRRRDFLCNLLFELPGTLLFFHPALHWIRRRMQETRELACDDMAAEALAGRFAYAHNLLQLTEKMRSVADFPQPNCALGIFEGENLEKRIMNLIETKTKQPRLHLVISVVLASCLALGTCALGAVFGIRPLLAQASGQTDHAPSGWFMAGSKPTSYRTGVDKAAIYDGQPSAYLQSAEPKTDGFGTLMQTINAASYAGKRVRLRASVKSQDVGDWAGMWMRVDKDQKVIAFDNMQNRAIKGTHPWSAKDVVLDVPEDATSISFGILLTGEGEVWMNHLTFEIVGEETETTSGNPSQKAPLASSPVNLNFTN